MLNRSSAKHLPAPLLLMTKCLPCAYVLRLRTPRQRCSGQGCTPHRRQQDSPKTKLQRDGEKMPKGERMPRLQPFPQLELCNVLSRKVRPWSASLRRSACHFRRQLQHLSRSFHRHTLEFASWTRMLQSLRQTLQQHTRQPRHTPHKMHSSLHKLHSLRRKLQQHARMLQPPRPRPLSVSLLRARLSSMPLPRRWQLSKGASLLANPTCNMPSTRRRPS